MASDRSDSESDRSSPSVLEIQLVRVASAIASNVVALLADAFSSDPRLVERLRSRVDPSNIRSELDLVEPMLSVLEEELEITPGLLDRAYLGLPASVKVLVATGKSIAGFLLKSRLELVEAIRADCGEFLGELLDGAAIRDPYLREVARSLERHPKLRDALARWIFFKLLKLGEPRARPQDSQKG